MKIVGIIPARYGSTRFEGKPLIDICGKSMIQRVYEQASKAIEHVYVATDDQRIFDTVIGFGGKAVMTSADHSTGSNRCLEASKAIQSNFNHDIVINIQGDEPLLDPENLKVLSALFSDTKVEFATLIKSIEPGTVLVPGKGVHVIKNKNNEAIYFSRSVIPHLRSVHPSEWTSTHQFYHHIGVYGYTVSALAEFSALSSSKLEEAELLEQNRWIENGGRIKVAVVKDKGLAIDTPEDLEKVIKQIQQ